MKGFKLLLGITAAAALTLGLSCVSYAFHDGGVAYCDGCHSIHNSSGNNAMAKKGASTQFQGQPYLLQGSDQSSTCLICHAANDTTPNSYHIMTFPAPAAGLAPAEMTPGGDFAYLGKSYSGTTVEGAPWSSIGERHGHNVVAADYGLTADTTLVTAPGGTYSSQNLACSSCHDPHPNARIIDATGTIAYAAMGESTLPTSGSGSYGALPSATEAVGVYRLLGGNNYVPASYTGGPGFVYDPPVAIAPSIYNRSESSADTRVAYGKGMSDWCLNCHTNLRNNSANSANTALIHPAGDQVLLTAAAVLSGRATTIAAIYNAYVKSGDLSGSAVTAYTSMVPYEEGTSVIAVLAGHAVTDGSVTTGPTTGKENVMCLSCHRAHATGFDSITRWNNRGGFITIAAQYPGSDAPSTEGRAAEYSTGKTQAEYQTAMYGRPAIVYATRQRSLCNKCHAQD